MLQQDEPDDFVIASGTQHSVRQFIEWSAAELGLSIQFEGEGVDEYATVTAVRGDDAPAVSVGDVIVRVDPRYFRPTEVDTLLGDPTKARERLGWAPKTSARDMCREMVEADLEIAKRSALLERHGFHVPIPQESQD